MKQTQFSTPILKRIRILRREMERLQIDTLMISNDENRRYLSGFTGRDTQFDESAGTLFITHQMLLLATDSRYETQAASEASEFEVYCYKEGLYKSMPDIARILGSRRIGFESIRISVREYGRIADALKSKKLKIELIPVEDLVEKQRAVKSNAEIEAIRKSLSVTESAFSDLLGFLRPGLTEAEAAWALEKRMRQSGADELSFPVIVASGPNSALPHAIPGNRAFKPKEPVLFDWGAKVNGYCSDISRTLFFGKPDPAFKKIFTIVKDAQQKAIDAIRAGVSSKSVDRIARSHIARRGLKDRFGHGLGHGLGLAIHEAPRLSPVTDGILLPGMVVTVEPGVYIPGKGGIRIENIVVVRRDGAEVLNRLDIFDSPVTC
ncbi:MAG: Xaa-Pro peptidase family protein [Thermodesulfobacteriota bacterium]